MLLYFIISNFIINIIFLGLIFYFIVKLSNKCDKGDKGDKGSSQPEISLKSSNKNLVSSQSKSNGSNGSDGSDASKGKYLNSNKKDENLEPKKVKFVYDKKKMF